MESKLRMNKSKMYQLARNYVGNVPKMINTEFKSYKSTYWMKFVNTENGHNTKVLVDLFCGDVCLMISDLEDKTSKIVHLSEEEVNERILM